MRRTSIALVGALVFAAAVSGPAGAISYGEIDDPNPHRNVGALIAEWREPGVKEAICSGTLLADKAGQATVFLTAGHCTAFLESLGIPNTEVWVSFDADVDPVTGTTTLHKGTWTTHEGFGHDSSDPKDLAVVQFSTPVGGITPAGLPTAGQFAQMRRAGTLNGQRFTAVGYGVQERQNGGGPPTFPFDGARRRAVSTFNALNKAWLRLSQNPSKGDGGTCFGDSGGPNFLGVGSATRPGMVAAVTVTGDSVCRATNVVYRLDTEVARDFLGRFVTLP